MSDPVAGHRDSSAAELEALRRRVAELENALDETRTILRRKQGELEAIWQGTEDVICVLDRDGVILSINRVPEQAPIDDIVGTRAAEYLDPDCLERYRAALDRVFDDGELDAFEHGAAAGSIWQARLAPLRVGGGVVAALVISRDITTWRKVEKAFVEKGRLFNDLVTHIQEVFFIVSADMDRFQYVSPAYEVVTGQSCQSLIDDPYSWIDLIHADDRKRARIFLETTTGDVDERGCEFRFHRPDGSVGWIWIRSRAVLDGEGHVLCHTGVANDITERKLAEEALARNEEQFRQIAEQARHAIWLGHTGTTKLAYANPAYQKIWGPVVGFEHERWENWYDSVHPEDRERVRQIYQNRREDQSVDLQYRVLQPDGSSLWMRDRCFPVRDSKGRWSRMGGMAEEVTREVEDEHRRFEAERAQKVAVVKELNHRVKNTLQGTVGLIRKYAQEHPATADALGLAEAQIQSLATVHGLKAKNANEGVYLVQLLTAIVRHVALTTRRVVTPSGLELAKTVQIVGDESAPIALVLNELVFNAAKHSKAGDPPVRVEIRRQERGIQIVVSNSGTLPDHFDYGGDVGVGTGLQLARVLSPQRGAELKIQQRRGCVEASFSLTAPHISEQR